VGLQCDVKVCKSLPVGEDAISAASFFVTSVGSFAEDAAIAGTVRTVVAATEQSPANV
jgi:hypothetical protein